MLGQTSYLKSGLAVISKPSDRIFVLPHELGHAFGVDHVMEGGVQTSRKHRLMSTSIPQWNNNYHDAKRFTLDEFKIIKKSPFYVPTR